jgi:hypothetical protein
MISQVSRSKDGGHGLRKIFNAKTQRGKDARNLKSFDGILVVAVGRQEAAELPRPFAPLPLCAFALIQPAFPVFEFSLPLSFPGD